MYLTPTDQHWIIDIETDGLDPTRVWVMCAKNVETEEEITCGTYEEIQRFFEQRGQGVFVGHNIIGFDAPVLNRLLGCRIGVSRLVDTFVLSSLYSPSIQGGHSLAAWGERLGFPKQEHDEWDRYSDAMRDRCIQDVEITWQLYTRLIKRMKEVGFTEQGAALQHRGWAIIKKQQKNGFAFNLEAAHHLLVELRQKERELKERIHVRFPPEERLIATYRKANTKSGEPSAGFKRHADQFNRLEVLDDGSYEAYGDVDFNLGSPSQRVEKLLELGWVPLEFTSPSKTHPEGQPKATENGELSPSLRMFAEEKGIEEVKLIAQWIAVNARGNAVGNWMDLYDHGTGCIHGNLRLANTLRYRHDKPNTANIPRVREGEDGKPLMGEDGWWTYEARDLWITRDHLSRRLVGVDAKGIQLRVLAHYLDDKEFTNAILSDDPHTANQKRLGLATRSLTKTIIYATLMGAGDGRIAREAGVSFAEARSAKRKFFQQVPGLPKLIERLQGELARTGRITLCDGSRILVSSAHMVIPYLLQGDESRIMTQASIYVDEEVRREKLDALKVGDIHDEWQNDVLASHVYQFGRICKDAFGKAGRTFNYNLPIECEIKEGLTWAETH